MTQPGPFLAGQRVTAGQLNDATQKTLDASQIAIAGVLATTSGTTELDIPEFATAPMDWVAGGLYRIDVRLTLQMNVSGAQEYALRMRRDTPLVGAAVASWVIYNQVGTGGFQYSVWADFESAVDDPAVQMYLSLQRVSGANTLSIYGGDVSGTNRPTVAVERVGYSSALRIVT